MMIARSVLLLLDPRKTLPQKQINLVQYFQIMNIYRALKDADLVILLGARLNWMLHFGQPPRYSKDVKFVQV